MDKMKTIYDRYPEKARKIVKSMSKEDMMSFVRLNMEIDKKSTDKDIPKIFKILNLFSYKCKRCGHCCRSEQVQLEEKEELLYAKLKGEKFFDMIDNDQIIPHLKRPCPFLKDNLCEINDIKPLVCKLYPFNYSLADRRFMSLVLCPLGESIFNELHPIAKKEQKKEMKKLGISEEKVNELAKEFFDNIDYATSRFNMLVGNNYESNPLSSYKVFKFPREDIELLYKKLIKSGKNVNC